MNKIWRDELKNSDIQVTGVYPGYMDTAAMSTDITVEKARPGKYCSPYL